MQWYAGTTFYDTLLIIAFCFAFIILLSSFFGTAQYGGRFGARGKGIKLGSKVGWIVMEFPGLLVFPIIFFMGRNAMEPVPLFFLCLWMMHYANRALITRLLMRVQPGSQSSFYLSVILMGWNLGAVFVLAITVANLVPRALYTHKWFRQNFDNNPAERKAVIPYIL